MKDSGLLSDIDRWGEATAKAWTETLLKRRWPRGQELAEMCAFYGMTPSAVRNMMEADYLDLRDYMRRQTGQRRG